MSSDPSNNHGEHDDLTEEVERRKFEARKRTLIIVRGYVLLIVGVGLIIFAFIPPVKPASMTLGGAMIGFNPILRSMGDAGSAASQSG